MKIAHIVAGISAAATIATSTASCTPPHNPAPAPATSAPSSGAGATIHVSDNGLTYDATCGAGSQVLSVTPDNPATRADATRSCGDSNWLINSAPWSSGAQPIPGGGS